MADGPQIERWRRSADAPPSWIGGEDTARRACAFCGEVPPPASSFCPNCGRAVTASILTQQGESATVLFTDIEDSTHLTERLGDAQWESIIDDHNNIVREELDRYAGFEVKLTGDGFLILFTNGMQALRCAARIQARVTSEANRLGAEWPVRVRMGIHRGDVIYRPGGDILGRTVNMAARVMAKGRGGTIVVSQALHGHVGRQIAPTFWVDMGARRIRGLNRRERMFLFDWPEYLRHEASLQYPGPDHMVFLPDDAVDPFDPILTEAGAATVQS